MLIGPRYKKAKKLGAHIFDKTQTAKFALRQARKKGSDKRGKPKSEFGLQLLEKQKARFTYGVNERQFSKYVKGIVNKKEVIRRIPSFKSLNQDWTMSSTAWAS